MVNAKWDAEKIQSLYDKPLFELVNLAYLKHKEHFDPAEMEYCTLCSIKTGACPEDCAYCPQSGHYNTGLEKEKLMDVQRVITDAKNAKANGAKRFCMGAAWKNPPKKDFPKVIEMVKAVKDMGLETCLTLGMLDAQQATDLKEAGLDYYNHNLDTSPDYYKEIITTRTYEDRLETISHVSNAGINVCCGGIVGMGETKEDRIQFLLALSRLPTPPSSIPINKLIPIEGTPLEKSKPIPNFELVKTIAVARLIFPTSKIRLAAGREDMPNEAQAFCFMAGANSIFIGDVLLTADNQVVKDDVELMTALQINPPESLCA